MKFQLKKIKLKNFIFILFSSSIITTVLTTNIIYTNRIKEATFNNLKDNLQVTERLFNALLWNSYTNHGIRLKDGVLVKGDVNLEEVSSVFDKTNTETNNIVSLINKTTRINSSDKNTLLSKLNENSPVNTEFLQNILDSNLNSLSEEQYFYDTIGTGANSYYACYKPIYDSVTSKAIGFVEILTPLKSFTDILNKDLLVMRGISVLILILSLFITYYLGKTIEKNTNIIKNCINKFGNGNFQISNLNKTSLFEFTEISNDLNNSVIKMKSLLETNQNVIQSLNAISDSISKKSSTIASISSTSEDFSNTIYEKEIQQNNIIVDLEKFSEGLSTSVDTTFNSSKNISRCLTNINDTISNEVSNVNILQDKNKENVKTADKVIQNTSYLSDKFKTMTELLKQIENTLKETNLLSLNAAIEAAKSTDSQNGFSVIATEIKVLSNKCNDYTQNLKLGIDDIYNIFNDVFETISLNSANAIDCERATANVYSDILENKNLAKDINETISILLEEMNKIQKEKEVLNQRINEILLNSQSNIANAENIKNICTEESMLVSEINEEIHNLLSITKDLNSNLSEFKF